MELVLPLSLISVPSVLVQSDSDPCFRMILTHSYMLFKFKKWQNIHARTQALSTVFRKKAYIILCRGIHEHKHMKLHTDMYDAYCSFACLHVLKQLKNIQ